MCLSSPDIPAPPPPPQDVKQPDTMTERRKARKVGMGGGSLLTGPSGVATASQNTGGSTLLGG